MLKEILKTYKVRLEPNNKQKTKLVQFAGTARWAYNWALDQEIKYFKETGKYKNQNDLRKELTILKQNDSKLEWLYDISCNVVKQAIKDLDKSYKKFFKIKNKKFSKKKIEKSKRTGKTLTYYDLDGHPKFKSKKHSRDSFYNDSYRIQVIETHIKLEMIGWIRLSEKNRIPLNTNYYNIRVSKENDNWYVSLSIKEIIPQPISGQNPGVGIDLGLNSLMMMSNGTIIDNINKTLKVRRINKKIKRKQRKISRKYEMNKLGKKYIKTKNIIKEEIKLQQMRIHLKNIKMDYIHKITSSLVKTKPGYVVMEDLNIKGMMKNRHLSRSIQENCWGEIQRQLEYKCLWQGIPFVKVDRFSPSSKQCSNCGCKKTDLKLSDRIFICNECGFSIDRDLNASINLRNKYRELHGNLSLWSDEQTGLVSTKRITLNQEENINFIRKEIC